MGKKTVTLPKQYWDQLYSLADELSSGERKAVISDALFMVVDLGLKAMANEDAMSLLMGTNEEEGEEEEEELIEGPHAIGEKED